MLSRFHTAFISIFALVGLLIVGCSSSFMAKEEHLKNKVYAHVYNIPSSSLHSSIKPMLESYMFKVQVKDASTTYGEKSVGGRVPQKVTCVVFALDGNKSRAECTEVSGSFSPARSVFYENQLLRVNDKAVFDAYEAEATKVGEAAGK